MSIADDAAASDHFDYDAVRIYVEALGASATRCRRILVVLAVASVLFFVAFWNSREDAWLSLRIRIAQACLREQAYLADKPEPKEAQALAHFLDLRAFMVAAGLFDAGVTDDERRALLEADVQEYRKLKKDHVVLVNTPLILTVFDINDLGIIAGITFSLLLLGYWFSVTRERDTLVHAFDGCRLLYKSSTPSELVRKRTYAMLSTSQVLNVPNPSLVDASGRRDQPSIVKKYLAKLLVTPPMLIQMAIMWNDQATLKYGLTLGQRQTSITLMIEGALLFAILVLTILCTMVSVDITRRWDDEFDAAHETRPPQPPVHSPWTSAVAAAEGGVPTAGATTSTPKGPQAAPESAQARKIRQPEDDIADAT
jgi:hypothetical protein